MSVFTTQAFQQTRHARRIYIGSFPPNYADEEALKFFLNSVIAKGLGEQNDNSYVLSIYVNAKKCFAFVELRSIELATACLELDGIIYKKVALKVLRANEYKPELIPPSMVGMPITLDLSSFQFNNSSTAGSGTNSAATSMSGNVSGTAQNGVMDLAAAADESRMDSIIRFTSLTQVDRGSVTIVGYPFDDKASTTSAANMVGSGSGLGCAQAPKKLRNLIRKYKFGFVQNPEYELDLSACRFIDVGDVLAGKSREDTKSNLSATVSEIVLRGGLPFVVGGSSDCSYFSTLGLINALGGSVGVVNISAQLHGTKLLDDPRFCPTTFAATGTVADEVGGRYVAFGAQGSQCSMEAAKLVLQRGGHISWLGRDIRNHPMCNPFGLVDGRTNYRMINKLPMSGIAAGVEVFSVTAHAVALHVFRESLRRASGQGDGESAAKVVKGELDQVSIDSRSMTPNSGFGTGGGSNVTISSALGNSNAVISGANGGAAGRSDTDSIHSLCGTPGDGAENEQRSYRRPVAVLLDMGSLCSSVRGCGYLTGNNSSSSGLTMEEALDIAMIAGADTSVVLFSVSEFSPDAEDSRSNMLIAELFYRFSLGVASRPRSSAADQPHRRGSRSTCASAAISPLCSPGKNAGSDGGRRFNFEESSPHRSNIARLQQNINNCQQMHSAFEMGGLPSTKDSPYQPHALTDEDLAGLANASNEVFDNLLENSAVVPQSVSAASLTTGGTQNLKDDSGTQLRQKKSTQLLTGLSYNPVSASEYGANILSGSRGSMSYGATTLPSSTPNSGSKGSKEPVNNKESGLRRTSSMTPTGSSKQKLHRTYSGYEASTSQFPNAPATQGGFGANLSHNNSDYLSSASSHASYDGYEINAVPNPHNLLTMSNSQSSMPAQYQQHQIVNDVHPNALTLGNYDQYGNNLISSQPNTRGSVPSNSNFTGSSGYNSVGASTAGSRSDGMPTFSSMHPKVALYSPSTGGGQHSTANSAPHSRFSPHSSTQNMMINKNNNNMANTFSSSTSTSANVSHSHSFSNGPTATLGSHSGSFYQSTHRTSDCHSAPMPHQSNLQFSEEIGGPGSAPVGGSTANNFGFHNSVNGPMSPVIEDAEGNVSNLSPSNLQHMNRYHEQQRQQSGKIPGFNFPQFTHRDGVGELSNRDNSFSHGSYGSRTTSVGSIDPEFNLNNLGGTGGHNLVDMGSHYSITSLMTAGDGIASGARSGGNGKSLLRTHSNVSQISNSELHPFDESLDIVDGPNGRRKHHSVSQQHCGRTPSNATNSAGNTPTSAVAMSSSSGDHSMDSAYQQQHGVNFNSYPEAGVGNYPRSNIAGGGIGIARGDSDGLMSSINVVNASDIDNMIDGGSFEREQAINSLLSDTPLGTPRRGEDVISSVPPG